MPNKNEQTDAERIRALLQEEHKTAAEKKADDERKAKLRFAAIQAAPKTPAEKKAAEEQDARRKFEALQSIAKKRNDGDEGQGNSG